MIGHRSWDAAAYWRRRDRRFGQLSGLLGTSKPGCAGRIAPFGYRRATTHQMSDLPYSLLLSFNSDRLSPLLRRTSLVAIRGQADAPWTPVLRPFLGPEARH